MIDERVADIDKIIVDLTILRDKILADMLDKEEPKKELCMEALAVKEFTDFQMRHRKYGACDSEPEYGFRALMHDALKAGEWPDCVQPGFWELYSSVEGWEIIANQMTDVAHAVFNNVMEMPYPEARKVINYHGWDE